MVPLLLVSLAAARITHVPVPSHAPPATMVARAGDIPLKPPAGWTTQTKDGATVITPGDVGDGKVYKVVLTPLQTKAGTIDEVYEVGKKMIGEVGTYTALTKVEKQQSDGGWDYAFTIGTVEKGGNGLLVQVMGLKKGDLGGVIIVLSDGIETTQKYSDDFAQMIRSLGGARKPPPAPAIAAGSGTVDLQYTVPAGWTETKKQGITIVENAKDETYNKWQWTLIIMPSQPLTGSLGDNFKDYWKALITANYESDVVPLPLTARLDDGYVCAFDADGSAKHKTSGARPRIASVYLIAHGDRFVPIFGIIYGYDKKVEADFDRFIETARIPGSSGAKIPLFSKSAVAGEWSEGSSSIASYVTASGGYAGDASIYTGSAFQLRPDGSYSHTLVALSGSTRIKEHDEGQWSIDDNELVLRQAKGASRYSLLGYGVDPKAGRFLVLGTYANAKSKLSFSNPRGVFQATWYKSK